MFEKLFEKKNFSCVFKHLKKKSKMKFLQIFLIIYNNKKVLQEIKIIYNYI